MAAPSNWQAEARGILRAQLARKTWTYKMLARGLEAVGVQETPKTIGNRINRGSFTFAFFLQCMYVMGDDVVRLWDRTPPAAAKRPAQKPLRLGE